MSAAFKPLPYVILKNILELSFGAKLHTIYVIGLYSYPFGFPEV